MNRLVVVGGTDITPYIDWKTYKMNTSKKYESWKDGNYVEHRIYTREQMSGSFTVWLCGIDGMDTDAFMQLWESATNNNVTTLLIFDNVANEMKAIEAFCTITASAHNEMVNGNYFDKFKIEVSEK